MGKQYPVVYLNRYVCLGKHFGWESIMLIFFIFVADEILEQHPDNHFKEQHPDHHVNQASDEVKDVSQVS